LPPLRDAPRTARCSTDVQGGRFEVQLKDIELARPSPERFYNLAPFGGPLDSPFWVVCHEYRRSKRRCATVREMKEGPSRSAIRC
jgi:hypothetical protein